MYCRCQKFALEYLSNSSKEADKIQKKNLTTILRIFDHFKIIIKY